MNAASLTELWVNVTRAGGPVGFLPDAPEPAIAQAAKVALSSVVAGREHLVARWDNEERLIGVVFLVPGATEHTRHRATISRLMVTPDWQSQGVGTWLLEVVTEVASEIGLELLLLSVRDGHGLERFYGERGWSEVGRFPSGIRVTDEERRDEIWMSRSLPLPRTELDDVDDFTAELLPA